MIAIVAVEIGLVVTAFVKKGAVQGFIDKQLDKTLQDSRTNEAFFTSWDTLQRNVNIQMESFSCEGFVKSILLLILLLCS